MGKPKAFKKCLSFFLAFLMLLSSVTVGFTAFAAPSDWNITADRINDLLVSNSDITKFNDVAGYASYLNDIATGWYNDGNQLTRDNNSADKGHPASRYTYTNHSDSAADGRRGAWFVDTTENGNIYKVVRGYWGVLRKYCDAVGARERDNAGNAAKYFVNGFLGKGTGKAFSFMGNDYPGAGDSSSETQFVADYVFGSPPTNRNGRDKGYTTLLTLCDADAFWNSYGDDLVNLSDTGILRTVASWYMHTCGFRWGKNDGAPDVVGNINYPIIDRTYTAVCVNAPELKAFNEFFSSDYD